MLKIEDRDKPVVFALCLVAAVVFLCWAFPSNAPTYRDNNQNARSAQSYQCAQPVSVVKAGAGASAKSADQSKQCAFHKHRTIWQNVGKWFDDAGHFLLLATIALAILGYAQVEVARRSFKRQLRAYIQVEQGTLQDMGTLSPQNLFVGGWPASVITIKNTGQTPARNVIHFSAIKIVPFGQEALLSLPQKKEMIGAAVSTLGQNIPTTASRWMSEQMTQEELSFILSHRSAVFIYGCVFYEDIYKRRRTTTYRLQWTGSWPPPPNVILGFSPHGNDFT